MHVKVERLCVCELVQFTERQELQDVAVVHRDPCGNAQSMLQTSPALQID
jgi:hypothetical protein